MRSEDANRVTPLRDTSLNRFYDCITDEISKCCNTEAEQQVLGILMRDNRTYEYVVDIIVPNDFSHPGHQKLFFLIGQLISDGRLANPVTLFPLIKNDPMFPAGAQFLTALANCVITMLNIQGYAGTVADLARRREIIQASFDAVADAVTLDDPQRLAPAVIEASEQRLHDIAESTDAGGPQAVAEASQDALRDIEAAYQAGGITMIQTGLSDVDNIIRGLGPGDLVVLGGRPSMGKTSLAGNVAFNVARQEPRGGKHVLFFSLEMTKKELIQRWFAGQTGISTDDQRVGNIPSWGWGKLIEAEKALAELPLSIDHQPRLSVAQMRQRARRHKRRYGLSLIVVDHLQLVRQGGKVENRRLEIGDITSMLKAIAKELEVPVLALSQLSRRVEERDDKRPQLADLRESGDIEQDADVVMFIFREEYYLERSRPRRKQGQSEDKFQGLEADWMQELERVKGTAEIIIPKNRHGKTNTARVAWSGERQRFENLVTLS